MIRFQLKGSVVLALNLNLLETRFSRAVVALRRQVRQVVFPQLFARVLRLAEPCRLQTGHLIIKCNLHPVNARLPESRLQQSIAMPRFTIFE